jgi:hypothetical protein
VEWERKGVKQKGKLRGNRATEKIFIDNDLTKQEREIQKKLRATAREEKRKGKDAKVGYMKITIEKKVDGQKKRENGKKAQRGTRETRYEREGRSKSTILERGRIK